MSLLLRVFNQNVKRIIGIRGKATLPDLAYDYNALEPVISADIMRLHHGKHHQTYVNNYNIASEKMKEAIEKNDIQAQINLSVALKFNGGGHFNHELFWKYLLPKSMGGGGMPTGELLNEINHTFGSFDNFVKIFSAKTTAIQGSGWGWLGYCTDTKSLRFGISKDQDTLESSTGLKPLLGVDVWEHAYYLQYKNVRADYVKEIWQVINWRFVEDSFKKLRG